MTRTAGAPIGCQRPSRFWGLGCPKIFHEAEDTLETLAGGKKLLGSAVFGPFSADFRDTPGRGRGAY
ncbi:hypothetical protein, partial [Thiolapillus sp.]|uniref:hypothetical protein n=1 Tax=Thiolapillus sp. TaxID=2017437 RepID=UPI003AF73FBC